MHSMDATTQPEPSPPSPPSLEHTPPMPINSMNNSISAVTSPVTSPSRRANNANSPPGPLHLHSAPTHAERSNTTCIQQPKPHRKLTDAQKRSMQEKKKLSDEARQKMAAELDVLVARHRDETEDFARAHNMTVDAVSRLVGTSKRYQGQTRKPNLENAKLHAKSCEVNEGLPVGSRHRLKDIKEMVKEDEAYQNPTKEQMQDWMEKLEAHRELKQKGARPSNQSAALDVRSTLRTLATHINNLNSRTGAAVICFITRDTLEDTFEPNFIQTENAAGFLGDAYAEDPYSFVQRFEQWCCSKGKVVSGDTVPAMQKECSKAINSGLQMVTHNRSASMNYDNYDDKVVQKYGVQIVGWTYEKMKSPYAISSVQDLRDLRSALRAGSCHWQVLTKHEINAHAADIDARRMEGEVIGKTRKTRSDAGKKRGPRKNKVVDENQPPKKKQRTAAHKKSAKSQLPPVYKSRELLSTSEEEDEGNNSTGDD